MEAIIVFGSIAIFIGVVWIIFQQTDKKHSKLDLTSKDESKLSEEGVNIPEHIQEVHEEVKKAPRKRPAKRKVNNKEENNSITACDIVDSKIAAKPVIGNKNKK